MSSTFGSYIRKKREALFSHDPNYSLRKVAQRVGFQPAFLSKVEREEQSPPSEGKIKNLAKELGEDPDFLLALAGKVSSDLLDAIRKRPQLFPVLIRQLKRLTNKDLQHLVEQVSQK